MAPRVARTGLGGRPGCQPLATPAGSLPAAHANACHRALVPSLVLCHASYHVLRAPRHLPDYRSREQLADRLLLALEHIHDGFHKD